MFEDRGSRLKRLCLLMLIRICLDITISMMSGKITRNPKALLTVYTILSFNDRSCRFLTRNFSSILQVTLIVFILFGIFRSFEKEEFVIRRHQLLLFRLQLYIRFD
jgi:hypothetical protein